MTFSSSFLAFVGIELTESPSLKKNSERDPNLFSKNFESKSLDDLVSKKSF